MTMWMVRAERKSILFDSFKEKNVVALGWTEAGNFVNNPDPTAMLPAFAAAFPQESEYSIRVAVGQVARFISEPAIGDRVITYDASRRVYAMGEITGPASFDPEKVTMGDQSWAFVRPVSWVGEVKRDDLSQASRYSLGSLLTFFKIKPFTEEEFLSILSGRPVPQPVEEEDGGDSETALPQDIEDRSIELIKDMVASLSPSQMEHFVAGLLRGLGYHTRVSTAGPDRGEDILATPDALGLEDPRIVVEVKHRTAAIGAPDLRSFLGGRHRNDRGLYVSTGGFTKDAIYEAARANIPLRLMTLDDLVELVVQNYDNLDVETRTMLPLKRIYWPLS